VLSEFPPPPKIVPFMRYLAKYGRAGQATNENTIRRMRNECWIPQATNTHSEYVILIAFLLHLWLHERASMLRYTNSRSSWSVARMGERRGVYWLSFGGWILIERDHLGNPGVGRRIILRWIFRKWDVGVWTGLSWLRIGTGGGHLWMQ